MRGYRTIKYTLFVFCYFFWVVSGVLTAVGIYAKISKERGVVDSLSVDPSFLLISVGSVAFILAFLGCSGSLRNNSCLLKTFLGMLVTIVLLQITAGVVGYLFTDTVMERTEQLMMKAVVRYREDQDLENAIDFIQKKFQCCGVDRYQDWSHNVYFQCVDTNPSVEACGVPFSCCTQLQNQTVLNTMCGYGMQQEEEAAASPHIFTVGCLQKIILWIKNNLLLVAGLTGGLLLLEVVMVSLAAAQVSRINKVQKQKDHKNHKNHKNQKDEVWFPAFADFDDE